MDTATALQVQAQIEVCHDHGERIEVASVCSEEADSIERLQQMVRWWHPARVLEQHMQHDDCVPQPTHPRTEEGFGAGSFLRLGAMQFGDTFNGRPGLATCGLLLTHHLEAKSGGPFIYAGQRYIPAGPGALALAEFAAGDHVNLVSRTSCPIATMTMIRFQLDQSGSWQKHFCKEFTIRGSTNAAVTYPELASWSLRPDHLAEEALQCLLPPSDLYRLHTRFMPILLGADEKQTVHLLVHVYTRAGRFITQDLVPVELELGLFDLVRLVRSCNGTSLECDGRIAEFPSLPPVHGESWYAKHSPDPPQYVVQDILFLE